MCKFCDGQCALTATVIELKGEIKMIDYNKTTAIEYFEKKKEILDSAGRTGGVCTGVCPGVDCVKCPLRYSLTRYSCNGHETLEPLEAVKYIMDYEIPVDWSKVSVDTKVLVRPKNNGEWLRRHFAKYEDGKVYCWCDGNTSFTINKNTERCLTVGWEEAKLYKGEE